MSKYIFALSLCLLFSACGGNGRSDSTTQTEIAQEIEATGGQISSADERLTLTFPDGALAADTEITIRQLSDGEIAERYPDLEEIDFVYELGPDGYEFLVPIEVTYLLPADADADLPRALVSVSSGISESLGDVVYDPETGIVTGMLSHFSDVLGIPVNSSFDYPMSLEHFVGDPASEFIATAEVVASGIEGTLFPSTIGGDSNYAARTASGTDRFITINSYEAEINTFDSAGPPPEGSATISYTCNEAGIDSIQYRFIWTEQAVAAFDETISGSVDFETEITCIASTDPEPIEASLIAVGQAPEAIKTAGRPPYDFQSEDTLQRFLVSGVNTLNIVNSAGVTLDTFELFSESFGSLYLQHSTGGDFFFAYGPNGRIICPLEPGAFCESEAPNNAITTSAEYGVDANGEEVFNEVYRVRGGRVLFTQEQGELWQEGDLFDDDILNPANGLSFNLTIQAFAYEPLTPSNGIVITENGSAYFIDRNTNEVNLFSSGLGDGLRDIKCDQFSSGEYGCAIQSFTNATITPCIGFSGDDFTCGQSVSAGDGVSLGAAVNDQGNLAVVGADFTDSSIHLVEFTLEFEAALLLEFPLNNWFQIIGADPGASFSGMGHAELNPDSDAILVSGNGSDNAAIIPIDDLADLGLLGTEGITFWFQ